ncbi:MAG TPA: lactonase family protein [Sphaerochaeta sp.]|nr:lactonase family protein [Sphaerochaeta sp.]
MHYIAVGSRSGTDLGLISLLSFNQDSGSLADYASIAELSHPAYQLWDPKKRILYTISEREAGVLVGYQLDERLTATETVRVSTKGGSPCHLSFNRERNLLGISNYGGGSMLTVDVQTSPPENRLFAQYSGSGPITSRQEASHVHSTLFAEQSDALLAADLGADALYYYREQMQHCTVIPTPPGAGPRHMVYSSCERYLYVSAELSNEVLVYAMEEKPRLIQQIATLPPECSVENTTSHLALSGDGRFLYIANRGHDSLAIFSVNDGWLSRLAHAYTERVPWNFAFSPDEAYIIVANHDSDSVTVYPRDAKTGMLAPLVSRISVTRPSCITFLSDL